MEGRRFNDLFGSSIKTDADLVKAKLENPERYFAEDQQDEQERALDDLKQEVRDALPGARDVRDDGDRLSFTMPNGAKVEVQLSPSIEVSDTAAGRARAAHGIESGARVKINGRERTIGTTALVELSQLGRKGSAYHEVLHAVYDLCLTDKEKVALHRAFDKEAKAQGRDVYEVMADQYRDWMLARQQGRGTRFGKLWQKVKDMAAGLLRVLRRADHASDVFRRVESGKVWERPLKEEAHNGNEEHYLVTNVEVGADTEVPVIDVTNEPSVNINSNQKTREVAQSLIGKRFRIIGSDGVGQIVSMNDGKHFVHSSNGSLRYDATRKKALSVADKVLNNCIYIEKHLDMRHGSKNRYIELFAVVKDGGHIVRFRVVAKEGDKNSGEFKVGVAKFYDIIKNGELPSYDVLRRKKSGSSPFALTVSDLLKGVKDRQGNLYVNEDGSLNYDMRIFHDGKEQDGFSDADDSTHYSAEAEEAPRSFADKAFLKLMGRSHINGDKIIVEERKAEQPTIGLTNYIFSSPSRIASKVQKFRLFWRMADRAMNMLTKNRSYYMRKLCQAVY